MQTCTAYFIGDEFTLKVEVYDRGDLFLKNKDKEFIAEMLRKESRKRYNQCKYDCCNCDYGVMLTTGSNYSCAMDIVAANFERELDEKIY